MTRTVDLAHRADLLQKISAYVVEHGIADLSLRPLAEAVGASPRTLLYHFGSKDEIVSAVFRHIRAEQMAFVKRLKSAQFTDPRAICTAAWNAMTAPESNARMRLFFETFGLALRDPQRFPGFLDGAVGDWIAFFSGAYCAQGVAPQRARLFATILLAGYRGFMLDLAATGDRDRIGAAVDAWLDALIPLVSNGESHAEPT
jgi:AcrR family transcriptional regulator